MGCAKAQLTVAKFYLGEGVYNGIIESDDKKLSNISNLKKF